MITLQRVENLVCKEFLVSPTELKSKKRDRRLVQARKAYASLLRDFKGYTLHEIGFLLGKDHSSVVHYLKVWKDEVVLDKGLQKRMLEIREDLLFVSIKRDNENFVEEVMDAIVWDEKGTTRKNLEKLIA